MDRVRAIAHPGYQAYGSQVGVRALVRRDLDMRGDQRRKAGGFGERDEREEARGRDQVRVM